MTEQVSGDAAVECLAKGLPPGRGTLLKEITAGLDPLTSFLSEQYLEDYICRGGSKMKFVTGRSGSGKTHFSMRILDEAAERGFLTVSFSAKDVWLHDFREIYLEILRQCDIEHVLQGCAGQIIRELGYDPTEIEEGKSFMDFLSERGEADPISRGEIRSALRTYFTKNPLLDNNFAFCCSILTGGILGHPVLEPASRELVLSFLHGDKSVKLGQLRALGLSPSRVTKINARHLLRSLAEVVHLAGYAGMVVCIDDLEMLMNRAAGTTMRYTKLRRNDAFESIRQLIDDIDNMRYILFLFAFDRGLMDNENAGFKTYQALWMRISGLLRCQKSLRRSCRNMAGPQRRWTGRKSGNCRSGQNSAESESLTLSAAPFSPMKQTELQVPETKHRLLSTPCRAPEQYLQNPISQSEAMLSLS